MIRKIFAIVILIYATLFTSCTETIQTIRTVQTGVHIYETVSVGYNSFYAYKMLQSLRNAKPIFKDYQSIKVEALVFPRKNMKNFPKIFQENLAYNIEQALKISELNKTVCLMDDKCIGKTIIVRFIEEGYKDDIAHRLFLGGKLKGSVQYIDKESRKILHEDKIELAKNYEELFRLSITGIEVKLLKELEVNGEGDKLQKAVNELNKINPIKPEYKEYFENS